MLMLNLNVNCFPVCTALKNSSSLDSILNKLSVCVGPGKYKQILICSSATQWVSIPYNVPKVTCQFMILIKDGKEPAQHHKASYAGVVEFGQFVSAFWSFENNKLLKPFGNISSSHSLPDSTRFNISLSEDHNFPMQCCRPHWKAKVFVCLFCFFPEHIKKRQEEKEFCYYFHIAAVVSNR